MSFDFDRVFASRKPLAIQAAVRRPDFPRERQVELIPTGAFSEMNEDQKNLCRAIAWLPTVTGEALMALWQKGVYVEPHRIPACFLPRFMEAANSPSDAVDLGWRTGCAVPAAILSHQLRTAPIEERGYAARCKGCETADLLEAYRFIVAEVADKKFCHPLGAIVGAEAFPANDYADEILAFGSVPAMSLARRADLTQASLAKLHACDNPSVVCDLIKTHCAKFSDDEIRQLIARWTRHSEAHNILPEIAKFASATIRSELFDMCKAANPKGDGQRVAWSWVAGHLLKHEDFTRWDEADFTDYAQCRAALENKALPTRLFTEIFDKGDDRFLLQCALKNPNFPLHLIAYPANIGLIKLEAAPVKRGAVTEARFRECLDPKGKFEIHAQCRAAAHPDLPRSLAPIILEHPEPKVRAAYLSNPSFPCDMLGDFLAAGFAPALSLECEPAPTPEPLDDEESEEEIPKKSTKAQDSLHDLPLFAA